MHRGPGDYRNLADAWFDQIRTVAIANGFAVSVKEVQGRAGHLRRSIREAAQVIRVLLTGSTRSPALHLVTAAFGEPEVRRRIGAGLGGELTPSQPSVRHQRSFHAEHVDRGPIELQPPVLAGAPLRHPADHGGL